jgi:tripartite-type tricarboxylate transporter receptor subunit TctC
MARSTLLPAVPTAREVDLAYPIRPWWGLAAPAGTPEAIIVALNDEIGRLFGEPQITEFMIKQFIEPTLGTSGEFAKFLESDRAQVGALVEKFQIPRN